MVTGLKRKSLFSWLLWPEFLSKKQLWDRTSSTTRNTSGDTSVSFQTSLEIRCSDITSPSLELLKGSIIYAPCTVTIMSTGKTMVKTGLLVLERTRSEE